MSTESPQNNEDAPPSPPGHGFVFELSENDLYARSAVLEQPPPTSAFKIKRVFQESEYNALFLLEDELPKLVTAVASGEEELIKVAERRDAQYSILVSSDKMEALIKTEPAYGGEPLSREAIEDTLNLKKVVESRWIKAAIIQAVESEQVDGLSIAQGIEPQSGTDARMTSLIKAQVNQQGQEDDHDRVDHHQLYEYTTVEIGDPLMRKTPATAGIPGTNVLGEPVNPRAGTDIEFARLEGSELDPSNENLLLASERGHPIVMSNGVRVDKTLRLPQVDLATGNIDFDGSIDIKGDITSGFVVNATGDIRVGGSVDNSQVSAGGSLIIVGGALGHEPDEHSQHEFTLVLSAGMSLQAKFVSYGKLRTIGTLVVRKYIAHCDVEAEDEVLLGQQGGEGVILGGQCTSAKSITANVLGSNACIKTRIVVGVESGLEQELEALQEVKDRNAEEAEQLHQILETISPSGDRETHDKAQKISNTVEHINREMAGLDVQIAELERRIDEESVAFVDVKKQLYPAVTITIEGIVHSIEDEESRAKIIRKGRQLQATR
ncbi:MAG: DUF342 domain-containing protein [Proteobacteria bacterium]|nr:DUF342 domain-containing protein [Pseudomonadota bacterium]